MEEKTELTEQANNSGTVASYKEPADIFEYKKHLEAVRKGCGEINEKAEKEIKILMDAILKDRPRSKKGEHLCENCEHFSLEYVCRFPDEDHTMLYKCANCGREREFI